MLARRDGSLAPQFRIHATHARRRPQRRPKWPHSGPAREGSKPSWQRRRSCWGLWASGTGSVRDCPESHRTPLRGLCSRDRHGVDSTSCPDVGHAVARRPEHLSALAARGESRRCIRPALHPGCRRCSSLKYYRYFPSSRLGSRAHHRSRCDAGLSRRAARDERPSARHTLAFSASLHLPATPGDSRPERPDWSRHIRAAWRRLPRPLRR